MSAPTPDRRRSRWTDHTMDQFVGNLLRGGVLVAAAVTAIGGAVVLLQHGSTRADYRAFISEPAELRSIGGVVTGAAHGHGPALVQLGLLLLIATPIARVALSLVAFALQRDKLYIGITSIVFAILLFSLVFGGHP